MKLSHYTVIHDAALIDEQFGMISPFNLKSDIKSLHESELAHLGKQIAITLNSTPGSKAYVIYIEASSTRVSHILKSDVRIRSKTKESLVDIGASCLWILKTK